MCLPLKLTAILQLIIGLLNLHTALRVRETPERLIANG